MAIDLSQHPITLPAGLVEQATILLGRMPTDSDAWPVRQAIREQLIAQIEAARTMAPSDTVEAPTDGPE